MVRKTKNRKWQHWQTVTVLLLLFDLIAVNAAYFLALWLRFDFRFSLIPEVYLDKWLRFAPFYTVLCLGIYWAFHLYKSLWEFASYDELKNLMISTGIAVVAHAVGIILLFGRMPNSYYLLGAVFQFVAVTGARFSFRFFKLLSRDARRQADESPVRRCLLIGAGAAGQMILRDLHHARNSSSRVLCIIDDDENKQGRYVEGVRVVGGREDILAAVEQYDIERILVAIPSAGVADRREILNICKESGCELKSLPSIQELTDMGSVTAAKLRDVRVEDLLGREPIQVEMEAIYRSLRDKVILVTGGGGSIGSELCRQIAGHDPRRLVIFDIYENNAYDIEQELRHEFPKLNLSVEIGSVRDSRRVDQLFEKYRPDIVYHAAAHKHVPLMEGSPCEAVKNNVFGTYKTAYAAMRWGCRRFVLVSTDKAVNPTNIMGASKRLCEMIIQTFDRKCKAGRSWELPALHTHGEDELIPNARRKAHFAAAQTEFVAVRFGNVLGSNGSVVPLFRKMIERGGPVEVTHKDVIRYFMTIPEAVSLILQAGTYAHGGEIFVLDMGEPVKIDTLARNLIKLCGYVPDRDIRVVYTGLRPGEKLYEEKLMAEEGMQTTPNKLIHVGQPLRFDEDALLANLPLLMETAYRNDEAEIRDAVRALVDSYSPAEQPEPVEVRPKKYVAAML
ncbi:MAG: polysaccharide biosynthesis protein [Oscillospiraceae bacterium]|nr:polysaccharide biosynthesis protein [Oscillospiraceae bacterium]